MKNKDMPAMPQSDEMSKAFIDNDCGAAIGYTKREQAAIKILAGLVANQLNFNATADSLVDRAFMIADKLFDRMDGDK